MAICDQTQLDELCQAWIKGVLSVGHGDKRVQYDSEAALWRRIVRCSRALGVPIPGTGFRRSYGSFRRSSC